MGKEIERKFLVKNHDFKKLGKGVLIKQGFLSSEISRVVRVRVMGNQAFLTIKGKSIGASRTEFEYEIPLSDAETMINDLCEKPIIEKIRYRIFATNVVWEVDEFKGLNEGLIIAEVELTNEDQVFNIPDWVGNEVTHDPRYYNSNLIRSPYISW